MTTIIKRCSGEKTRGIRAIDEFRNKLMIPDSEIPKSPEFEVKSKIGNIFKKHNPHEEYSVKIYEIDPFFINIKKKIQAAKNECKYMVFGIDIYFDEFSISSRNWWKRTYWQIYYFWKKRQKALEKKIGCKFIRINTSNVKNGYDLDYEVGNIEAFIDEFKNKKIKELEAKIKELEDLTTK